MSGLTKKIEVTSNIVVILVAILFGATLVNNYLLLKSVSSKNENNARTKNDGAARLIGKSIQLPGVDWAPNKQSLILFIRSTCHFCTESAEFYRQLVKNQFQKPDTALIAVSTDSIVTTKSYLTSLDLPITTIVQSDLSTIGVPGTPTILQVDRGGLVTNVWLGKLDKESELRVLAQLQEPVVAQP
jgi:peroxiredoxin